MTSVATDRKTALYRFYDSSDTLLYVGITFDINARLSSHRADKLWWDDVSRIEITRYGTRKEAEDTEKIAVRDENPQWNIAVPDENGKWRMYGRRSTSSTSEVPRDLTPTEAGKVIGRSASTVRRYEDRGYLAPTRRLPGSGHRRYRRADVVELKRKIDAGELDNPEGTP